MDLGDVERVVRFEHYVRTQLIGEDGYNDPVTNIGEEDWEPVPSRDPQQYAEALRVCLEHHHEGHEFKCRVWVETWIRR